MKALVDTFNQEKALVGAFSVIVQLHRLIDLRHYSPLNGPGNCGGDRAVQRSGHGLSFLEMENEIEEFGEDLS